MRRLAGSLAGAVAGAAVLVGLSSSPAQAATCAGASGVSVVVDFKGLGGIQSDCVSDGGGRSAASLFTSAGFPLEYVQGQGDFVCKVKSAPADANCARTPPANAYWSLWWSDGKSGRWSYATRGVSSLTIPAGGYVAFAWDGSGGDSTPSVPATAHPASTPTPTTAPTTSGGGKGTKGGKGGKGTGAGTSAGTTGGGAGANGKAAPSPAPSPVPSQAPSQVPSASVTGVPTPSATPTSSGAASASAPPTGSPTAPVIPTDSATATDVPVDDTVDPAAADEADGGGLPTWAVLAVLVLVFAAVGGVAVVRRRGGASA